jgi:hypothetical protein
VNPSAVFLIAPSVLASALGLAERRLVFSDIGSMRSDIHEADDVRMNTGLGDDRAAVTVAHEQRRAVLKVENPLRCGYIVGARTIFFRGSVLAGTIAEARDKAVTRARRDLRRFMSMTPG